MRSIYRHPKRCRHAWCSDCPTKRGNRRGNREARRATRQALRKGRID
jgi:hypothetical protein